MPNIRIDERDVIRFSQIYYRTTDVGVRLYFDLDGETVSEKEFSFGLSTVVLKSTDRTVGAF